MAKKLKKNLNLFDVYAMSTGAMFSSGLFLCPESPLVSLAIASTSRTSSRGF